MLKLLFSLLFLISYVITYATVPEVIAHRGYWNTQGSTRNSIRALIKADSIGCYGSEFDVWMTLDSVLVINHDPVINGVNIEKSLSKDVLSQKLSNGENVPTLEQFLTTAKNLKVRLVCEIKEHDSRSRERECIRRTLKMMKDFGLENRVEYLTFSKDGVLYLIKKVPEGTSIQYPAGDMLPEQMHAYGGKGLNYRCSVLKKNPEMIERCHKLGLKVKVWEIKNEEDMKWCMEHNVDFLTSDDPEVHLNQIKKLKNK